MYILSNGVKISEKMHQRLCQAIKDISKKYIYFLDMETGKLVKISRVSRQKLTMIEKKPQRFIPLPKVSKDERRKRFVYFVEELGIIGLELQKRLSKEIKKGLSIDELEKILEKDSSGWIHGWVQDEQSLLAERIKEWITSPPLNAEDDLDYWYDDDCPVCQFMKKMEKENKTPTIKETKKAFLKAKERGAVVGGPLLKGDKEAKGDKEEEEREYMEKQGLKYIGKINDFKMPKWMECTWRRVPCGRNDCPICGKIKKDRQKHIEKGEDPDDIKSVLEDVKQNFKQTLEMIKKDCEARGIELTNVENIKEPPEPEEFPLYCEAEKWNKEIFKVTVEAELSGSWWIYTEAAADLFWYANTLLAKTYRQLCNRWHIENGDEYGEFDYQYTKYVLEECFKILKNALKELVGNNYLQKRELKLIYSNLLKLEKQINKI